MKLLVVGFAFFILEKKMDYQQITAFPFSFFNLFIVGIFTLLNWFLEILKWKLLVKPIRKISFKEALKQSLGSHTLSIITPNRIGEYGAKCLFFEKSDRKKIIFLNFIGNSYQLLATFIFGAIGLVFIGKQLKISVAAIALTFVIGLLVFVISYEIFQKKKKQLIHLLPKKSQRNTFALALLRYIVFAHQFYYLLILFGISVSYLQAMPIIFCMYLFASIVPSISLFDFAIKGSIALYLFEILDIFNSNLASITFYMWFLNFAIPAIYGCYYILRFQPLFVKKYVAV